MAKSDWAERRQRIAKCKAHGLHYDPALSTGCTLCQREASKTASRQSPQLLIFLLCLLGMSAVLFRIFGPGQETSPDELDLGVAMRPAAPTAKLDPEPFRPAVVALETALFRAPIRVTDDLLAVAEDISASASRLSGDILSAEPTAGLDAADDIAKMGQAVPLDQVALSDVQRARDRWLRIRNRWLTSASWFADPQTGPGEASGLGIEDYSAVASDLRALIEDALAEASLIGDADAAEPFDGPADLDAGTPRQGSEEEWTRQLDDLRRRLPPRPTSEADERFLLAFENLERAIGLARSVLTDPNLGTSDSAETQADEAISIALRAQQGFDDLI